MNHRAIRRGCPVLSVLLMILICIPAGAASAKDFHHEFEAEAFDNIPSFGNWHPAEGTGWYIKEHIHATSQGIGVCDAFNEGAEMFKKLSEPIPAGEVGVFARFYAMRGGTKNAVEISLGNRKPGGEFEAVESFTVEWGDEYRGYFWAGERVATDKACDTIRVKAAKVGRTGIGDNPEQEYAMIWFDQIMLTTNEDVKIGKRGRLEKPKTATPVGEASEAHKQAKAFLEKNTDISLPYVPDKGNLLFNSGFELGFEPWWYTPDNTSAAFHLSYKDVSGQAARHGQYGLRAQLEQAAPSIVLGRWPVVVKPDTEYTLTLYARSDAPEASVGVVFYTRPEGEYSTRWYNDGWQGWNAIGDKRARSELTGEWKRHTFKIKTRANQQMLYFQVGVSAKGAGHVDLDSFMLTADGEAEYAQRETIEAAIHSRKLARVYYLGEPLEMHLAASAFADFPMREIPTANVQFEILGLDGEVLKTGHDRVTVRGKGTFEKTLKVPFDRRGSFIFRSRAGDKAAWQQFAFSVIEPPLPAAKRRAEPFITTIGNLSEPNCAVHAAGGYDGMVTLEGGTFMPIIGDFRLKEDGSIDFADEEVARARRHGLAVVGYIVPWTWGRHGRHEWIPTYREPITGSVKLALDAYDDYVRRTVEHFKDIRWWILEDEADMHWGVPSSFAPWVKRLYQTAKKANPDAMVMFSMMPQMFEAHAKTIGPQYNDGVGGSFHGNGPWFHHRVRDLIDRYDKDFSIDIGVGWTSVPTTTAVDPYRGLQPRWASAVNTVAYRVATDLVRQQAIVNYTMQCRYTSHLHWVHNWSFNSDDSYHPGSVTYVNTLQFLRGAKRGGILYCPDAGDVQAYHFVKDGTTCVMIAPTAWFDTTEAVIELDPSKVEILDRDINPVSSGAGDRLTLTLEPNSMFILRPVDGVAPAAFLDACRRMTARPVVWARTLALPAGEGLEWAVYVHNGSDRPMDGAVQATHGNLRNSADAMRRLTLAPGKSGIVRLPMADIFAGERSFGLVLDQFVYTDGKTFYRSNKGGWRSAAGLWMAKSLPADGDRAVKLDGNVDEWASQSGAYVYVSWAMDGSYGRRQGRYEAHRIDDQMDSSATIWSRNDDENLYLAARVTDQDCRFADKPAGTGETGDQLRIALDTRLLEDVASGEMDGDDYEIIVGPGVEEGRAHMVHDGKTVEIPVRFARTRDGWSVELAIPWKKLGGRKDVLGFNVALVDADGGLERKAELSWSGAQRRRDDPRGFGQLIVRGK